MIRRYAGLEDTMKIIQCPQCNSVMTECGAKRKPASKYEDRVRRCTHCQIRALNTVEEDTQFYILHRFLKLQKRY